MSSITTINSGDAISGSRSVINTNFSNLNTDKAEVTGQAFTGPVSFSGSTNSGLKVNSLSTTQRDALTPANGMVIYNSSLNQVQVYENGSWNTPTAASTDASTTVKGVVEEATQAEVDAKTPAGDTSARLIVNPSTMRSTLLSDYVADTGAADAYVITPSPAITAYATGQIFTFKASATNTTTSTINVNALGVKTIKKLDGATNLAAGDIVSGQLVQIEYNATSGFFQMMSPVGNAPVSLLAGAYPAGNGAALTGIYNYQLFTGSGTWTKPTGLTGTEMVKVQLWGGGGAGGGVTTSAVGKAGGGGGGNFKEAIFRASDLGSTVTVTIGAGGTGVSAAAGNAGGDTTFGSLATAYGGGGGQFSTNSVGTGGGGGGGALADGVTASSAAGAAGGAILGGAEGVSSNFGGGGGGGNSVTPGGSSVYGGGGGGYGYSGTNGIGGSSVYGGGGGGGGGDGGGSVGGVGIVYGGNGGAGASSNGVGTAGTAPAGGGGGSANTGTTAHAGGAGARGECRVWVVTI